MAGNDSFKSRKRRSAMNANQNNYKNPARNADDNIIFIGKKSAMAYVLACVMQFNRNQETVILKARGKSISHAVDVAEIVRNKFVTDTEVKDIKISTEILDSETGEKLNVSSIEIVLGKK